MRGHTNRETISRRPLTATMRAFLQSLKERSEQKGPGVLWKREMSQAEKNAARALYDRDLIGWDGGLAAYYINGAGLAALTVTSQHYSPPGE